MANQKRARFIRWAIIIALTAGFLYFTHTPQFTLIQIGDAFEAHDLQTFENYVNIDGLVESAVQQYVAAKQNLASPSLRDSELDRQRLIVSLRNQIVKFVKTGNLPYDPLTAEIVPDIGTLRNRFQGVDYLKVKGDVAFIGLQTRDDMGIVEIAMHRKGWFWRVDAINDLAEYWQRALR